MFCGLGPRAQLLNAPLPEPEHLRTAVHDVNAAFLAPPVAPCLVPGLPRGAGQQADGVGAAIANQSPCVHEEAGTP
jgi:hypothetical protein